MPSATEDEPLHVARFGERFDAQGVLAGSKDAARCIGYLTKYLTKQVADCHQAASDAQRAHVERLADALRYEPCSPRCANWLRYGIQPKNARPGLIPGACKGKAHRREYLGYAGRRVLVSRKWSGKTLADHRADRKNWLLSTLGRPATDPARYAWEPVTPGDPDHMEHARRLLHVVADRQRWQAALAEARRRAGIEPAQIFRQPGGRHDGPPRRGTGGAAAHRVEVAAILSTSERFLAAADRRTPHRVRQGRPSRPHPRIRAGRLHRIRRRQADHVTQLRTRKGRLMADAKEGGSSATSASSRRGAIRRATGGLTASSARLPPPSSARPTPRAGSASRRPRSRRGSGSPRSWGRRRSVSTPGTG